MRCVRCAVNKVQDCRRRCCAMRYYALACKQGPLDIASETRPNAASDWGLAIQFKTLSLNEEPLLPPPSPSPVLPLPATVANTRTRFCDQCRRVHPMNSPTVFYIRRWSYGSIKLWFCNSSHFMAICCSITYNFVRF